MQSRLSEEAKKGGDDDDAGDRRFALGPVRVLPTSAEVDVEQVWAYVEHRNAALVPDLEKRLQEAKHENPASVVKRVSFASDLIQDELAVREEGNAEEDRFEAVIDDGGKDAKGEVFPTDDLHDRTAEVHGEDDEGVDFFNADEMEQFLEGAEELAERGALFDENDGMGSVSSDEEEQNAHYDAFFGGGVEGEGDAV